MKPDWASPVTVELASRGAVMATGTGDGGDAATAAWFVPDTNFFLQCKPASDVDWSLVTDASEVVLVAVRTVQKEIDGHKGSGNHRRADRARAVASIFKTLLADDAVHVYRQANPRVVMRRGPRLDPTRDKTADFDPESNDDQIVEQVMATASRLGESIRLLTHDSGPMQTAHDLGVPFAGIPDGWLLPPESGPAERQVAALQKELRELRQTLPVLDVSAADGTASDGRTVMATDYFGLPDRALRNRAARAVFAKHSSWTEGRLGITAMASEAAVGEYNRKYQAWTQAVRGAVESAARRAHALTTVEFKLQLANTGRVSAEGVVVQVSANGPFKVVRLQELLEWEKDSKVFPSPPEAPSLFSGMADYLNRQPLLDRTIFPLVNNRGFAPARNPRLFYWEWKEREGTQSLRGECEEFRHGIHVETVAVPLLVPVEHEGNATGVVSVTISARNLPEPQVSHHKVLIERTPGDLEAVLGARLKDDLGVTFP